MGHFVVPPGRNATLDMAWKGLRAADRKESAPVTAKQAAARAALAKAEKAAAKHAPKKRPAAKKGRKK